MDALTLFKCIFLLQQAQVSGPYFNFQHPTLNSQLLQPMDSTLVKCLTVPQDSEASCFE